MPKILKELKEIDDFFDQGFIEIKMTLPDRKDTKYKKTLKSFFKKYLEFNGKLTKEELGALYSLIARRRVKVHETLVGLYYDYHDCKREYYKIQNTIFKYNEQRFKNCLDIGLDVKSSYDLINIEKKDIACYRYSLTYNQNYIEHSLKNALIPIRHEIRKYETTTKLLKILSREVNYLISVI